MENSELGRLPSKVASVRAVLAVRPDLTEGLTVLVLVLPKRLSRFRSPGTWRREVWDMLPRPGAEEELDEKREEDSRREEEERAWLSWRL